MDNFTAKLIILRQLLAHYQSNDFTEDHETVARHFATLGNVLTNAITDDDVDYINIVSSTSCNTVTQGPEGPPGLPGPQGEKGEKGEKGDSGECLCKSTITVDEDYSATNTDYYIGVNSENPVTITLPYPCTDCHEIIVKAEMAPPLGNRKITIVSGDENSTIDGKTEYVITNAYHSVNLICNNGNWFTK